MEWICIIHSQRGQCIALNAHRTFHVFGKLKCNHVSRILINVDQDCVLCLYVHATGLTTWFNSKKGYTNAEENRAKH